MVISQVHRRVGDQAVPRNVVLLLHRGELILATPSQLRSASETEKAMFQIDGVAGNLTPDFLEKVKKEAKQFLDLTGSSVPQEDDEHEAEQ